MDNESFESRPQYLLGKTTLTDDDIATVTELHHEYPDMGTLKRYTDKKFRDLTQAEKQRLIESLLQDDEYLAYKNCHIAKSKLLYDSSATLAKEIAAVSRLNDLGYEVYLLPYAYARDTMNCYQKSADSITAGDFLEMKSVISTGSRAGQSAFESARKQADNIYLSFENEISEERAISNIYRAIGNIKSGSTAHGEASNFEGMLFLNFEKGHKTLLYHISENGRVLKADGASYMSFKKIKGTARSSPQVVGNPMSEHGSSRASNIPHPTEKSSANEQKKRRRDSGWER